MTTYQLNPEQARALARKFGHHADVETTALIDSMKRDADRMDTMITDLNSGVKGMDWKGRRATSFDGMWESEFRPAMQRMRDSMQDFAPVLQKMQASLKEADGAMERHARDTEAIDIVH